MIRTDSLPAAYRTTVRSDTHELTADAPIAKGGGGEGFGAHQLLEASLATCINMAVRMHAAQAAIPLRAVSTWVELTWPDAQTTEFRYGLTLDGPLSEEQKQELHDVAENCPVRRTLSRNLMFTPSETVPAETWSLFKIS